MKREMKGKEYAKALRKLQVELSHLQRWVKEKGMRVIVVLEGRDGAGKGGTIKAITERVSPRVFRVVALPAPSDREKTQMYMQRYMAHFPALVKWSSSTGAGTTAPASRRSWASAPRTNTNASSNCVRRSREFIVSSGIVLIKLWLEVGNEEQKRRFERRIEDPLRQWKLSPMDLPSLERWYDYSKARDRMLKATDTKHAPWYVLRSDDKERARLNAIAHILATVPYKKLPTEKITLPKRSTKGAYDDQSSLKHRRFVKERY